MVELTGGCQQVFELGSFGSVKLRVVSPTADGPMSRLKESFTSRYIFFYLLANKGRDISVTICVQSQEENGKLVGEIILLTPFRPDSFC